MKIEVLQENLAQAISFASHFTNPRAQLPVLGNILLSAKKTKLLISSTNLETSAAIFIGAKVSTEGEITVPSKLINELVANLRPGTVSMSVDKEQLTIEGQSVSSKISGMNSADFPSVPTTIDSKNTASLSRETFSNSLSQVLYSASIDETRPVLTGVLFIVEKGSLNLVATDGFRLSKKTLSFEGEIEPMKVILPKSVLSELSRLTNTEKILFSFNKKDNQAVFGFNDTVLSSRIIEGDFPDFEKIIPKNSLYKVLADREELLRAIKLASVFAREGGNIVKLIFQKDALELISESSTSGSQKTKIDIKPEKGDTSKFEIAFNFRFLEEFLQSISGEEVSMEFTSEDKPGVFTDPKDLSLLHLIMPVKVQS